MTLDYEVQMKTRDIKDCAPWCWAEKAALEKIRARCEDAKTTLLVYFALCEVASDERSQDFMISMDKIAGKSCLSRPTVLKSLQRLEQIGLVEIHRSKTSQNFKIPSAYRMLVCESADKDRWQAMSSGLTTM